MRDKITVRSIERVRTEARQKAVGLYLWDTELRGFGCRASPTGGVSWLFQHWVGGTGGRPQRMVFNQYPALSVDDARKQAETLRSDVNKGIDVLDRKAKARKAKLEEINAVKLADAIALFVKRNSRPGRYWAELEQLFQREVITPLGKDITVVSITKQEVRNLIETKQDRYPGQARVLWAALNPFFKWCVERDYIAVSPLQNVTPPKLPQARDRVLSDQEIKSFWSATSDETHLFNRFHRVLLLTAQRREEVAGMRWSELDLQAATWTIPKERTKNNKAHLVHLSPQALAALPVKGESDFVFTTTGKDSISGYSKAKARLDELMQAKPWRVHDLRRTAASGMASLGFQPHVIERVLNHVSGAQGGLVSVYQRFEYLEERKRCIHAWGQHVEALVSDTARGRDNVIALRA